MLNVVHNNDLIQTNSVRIAYRQPNHAITEYLQNALPYLQNLQYTVDEEFNKVEAFTILDEDLPNSEVVEHKIIFINDIIHQCSRFWEQTISGQMTIQLEIITTDMCRLFHIDNYRQRLLCTYWGPGTEWLDWSNVNPTALGKGNNNQIIKDPSKIHRANPFDVLLIQGLKYGTFEESVVHRSPPISEMQQTRVLLKIDE